MLAIVLMVCVWAMITIESWHTEAEAKRMADFKYRWDNGLLVPKPGVKIPAGWPGHVPEMA